MIKLNYELKLESENKSEIIERLKTEFNKGKWKNEIYSQKNEKDKFRNEIDKY